MPSVEDSFWSGVLGVFPSGKFDRFYYTLYEPHNIKGLSSGESSVSLRLDSESVVAAELSDGCNMNPGTSFIINVE